MQLTNIEEASDYIAEHWVEEMLEPAAASGYICPICGNGSGQHGTGLTINPNGSDYWHPRYKCFKCDFYGDAQDLIKEAYDLTPSEAFNKACNDLKITIAPTAADVFGGDLEEIKKEQAAKQAERERQKAENEKKKQADKEARAAKVRDIIAKASSNKAQALDYLASRGISKEIAEKHPIGFLTAAELAPYKMGVFYDSLIIETGDGHAIARATTTNNPDDKNRNLGTKAFMNIDLLKQSEPVLVVEGEIDALSVEEVGGRAIALSGKGYLATFLDRLPATAPPLIIALDNEQATAENLNRAAAKINELTAKGYEITALKVEQLASLYLGEKDANDALKKDKENFKQQLEKMTPSQADALEDYKAQYSNAPHIKEYLARWREPKTPISTGLKELDRLLDGGLYSGVYVLGAMPSLGKTTLIMQIADNIAAAGRDVMIITLEQSAEELTAKSISRESAKACLSEITRATNGKAEQVSTVETMSCNHLMYRALEQREIQGYKLEYLDDERKQRLAAAAEKVEQIGEHLYIIDCVGAAAVDVFGVENLIAKHKRLTGNTPIVFIDYLQKMRTPIDRENPKHQLSEREAVETNSRELQRISRLFKTTVFVITSHNRAAYDGEPDFKSGKESGAIEYDADVLAGMSLTPKTTKQRAPMHIEFKLLKQRGGAPEGRRALSFYSKYNYFEAHSKETVAAWRREAERAEQAANAAALNEKTKKK